MDIKKRIELLNKKISNKEITDEEIIEYNDLINKEDPPEYLIVGATSIPIIRNK